MSNFFSSSIGRKVSMSLSAIFLMIFLILHVTVNFTSIFSEDLFNNLSHFMGTNLLVQFVMQPILIAGVIFHFVMGMILERKNRTSRGVEYARYDGGNSTWVSKNMAYSGLVILAFLGLHFVDFWFPEMNTKYIQGDMSGLLSEGGYRYYEELSHKFQPLWRVILYCISFILLALHLLHGFTSSLQSLGISASRKKLLRTIGSVYSIVIPLGFIIVALYHFAIH